jgi:hypothetical protein
MASVDPPGRRRAAATFEDALADAMARTVADLPPPRVDLQRARRRARDRGRRVLAGGAVGTALAGAFAVTALALPGGGPEVRPVVAGATATTAPVAEAPTAPAPPAAPSRPPAPPAAPPAPGLTDDALEVPADEVALVAPPPEGTPPRPCRELTGGDEQVRTLVVATARVLLQPALDGINEGLADWDQPPYVPTDDEIAEWVEADRLVTELREVDVVDCDGLVGVRGPGREATAGLLRLGIVVTPPVGPAGEGEPGGEG